MLTTIAVIFVLAMVGLSTYSGVHDGAYFAAYALMRNLIAFLLAMTFCEPVAMLLADHIEGQYPAYDYYTVIAFAVIAGTASTMIRRLKIKYTAPRVPCPMIVDRTAGPIMGFLNGTLLSGMVLVTCTLLPFLKYVPHNKGDLNMAGRRVDTGSAVLRFYDYVQSRFGGNDDFLLDENEPMTPDLDFNFNGQPDLVGEGYDDINGNGRWDRGWLVRYRYHAAFEPADLRRVLDSRLPLPPPPGREETPQAY